MSRRDVQLKMALSLVCQECNAQLRSVAEMQAHTEATNHTSFAESTEPVRSWSCSLISCTLFNLISA